MSSPLCMHYYSTPLQQRSIAISLSVCLCVCVCPWAYLWNCWTDPQNFVCRSPVDMARSSSGGVAIRYVLPVLWMTSCLSVMGCMAMRGRLNLWPSSTSGVAMPGQSLMSMNALLLQLRCTLPMFHVLSCREKWSRCCDQYRSRHAWSWPYNTAAYR